MSPHRGEMCEEDKKEGGKTLSKGMCC